MSNIIAVSERFRAQTDHFQLRAVFDHRIHAALEAVLAQQNALQRITSANVERIGVDEAVASHHNQEKRRAIYHS